MQSDSSNSRSPFSDSSSFCLSTACTDSADLNPPYSSKPTYLSREPYPSPHAYAPLEPDKSVYSFAWSSSSDCLEADNAIETYDDMSTSQKIPGNARKPVVRTEKRCDVPDLPRPVFWSSVANKKAFQDYVDAKQLLPHDRTVLPPAKAVSAKTVSAKAVSAKAAPAQAAPAKAALASKIKRPIDTAHQSEAVGKAYTNMKGIVKANTDDSKVRETDRSVEAWILDHFRNTELPAPFVQELLTDPQLTQAPNPDPQTPSALMLWAKSPDKDRMKDNFVHLPDLSSEAETCRWLTHYGRNIGKFYLALNRLHS